MFAKTFKNMLKSWKILSETWPLDPINNKKIFSLFHPQVPWRRTCQFIKLHVANCDHILECGLWRYRAEHLLWSWNCRHYRYNGKFFPFRQKLFTFTNALIKEMGNSYRNIYVCEMFPPFSLLLHFFSLLNGDIRGKWSE
jgi:hypothetical protein